MGAPRFPALGLMEIQTDPLPACPVVAAAAVETHRRARLWSTCRRYPSNFGHVQPVVAGVQPLVPQTNISTQYVSMKGTVDRAMLAVSTIGNYLKGSHERRT